MARLRASGVASRMRKPSPASLGPLMLLVAAPTAACGDPPTVAIDIAGENRPVWVSRIAEDGRIVEAGILYDGLVMPDRLTWSPDGD